MTRCGKATGRINRAIREAEESGVALSRRDWLIRAVTERLRADAAEAQIQEAIARYAFAVQELAEEKDAAEARVKELGNELQKAIAPSDVGGGPLAVAHDVIAKLERELAYAVAANELTNETNSNLTKELAEEKKDTGRLDLLQSMKFVRLCKSRGRWSLECESNDGQLYNLNGYNDPRAAIDEPGGE